MGDLIDRNCAVEILRAKANITVCLDIQMGYERAARIIEHIPAVDAEPVRHGSNMTHTHPSDMFICTECGFTCEITELRYGDDGMGEPDAYEYDCKFCPNCGAKMDGGD